MWVGGATVCRLMGAGSSYRRHQQRLLSRPGNSLPCEAARQQTSTRDVSRPKHNRNYTGLHNYTAEANYTDTSDECLGVVLSKCKARGLWDLGFGASWPGDPAEAYLLHI